MHLTFYGSRARDPHDPDVHDRNHWLHLWGTLSCLLWRSIKYLPPDTRTHEPPGLLLIEAER